MSSNSRSIACASRRAIPQPTIASSNWQLNPASDASDSKAATGKGLLSKRLHSAHDLVGVARQAEVSFTRAPAGPLIKAIKTPHAAGRRWEVGGR